MKFKKAFIGGIVIGAGTLYLLYKIFKNQKPKENIALSPRSKTRLRKSVEKKLEIQVNSFIKDQTYFEVVEKLKNLVKAELMLGSISSNVLLTIDKLIINLLSRNFNKISKKNEIIRKTLMNSLNLYAEAILELDDEINLLMKESRIEVLRDLEISEELYEKLENKFSLENPKFHDYKSFLYNHSRQKNSKKNNVTIDKQTFLKMLNFKKKILQLKDFSKLKYLPEQRLMIINSFISDIVYKTFGFDESFLIQNDELVKDQEIEKIRNELRDILLNSELDKVNFEF